MTTAAQVVGAGKQSVWFGIAPLNPATISSSECQTWTNLPRAAWMRFSCVDDMRRLGWLK